jgi:large subunit ribosomal protein L22
MEEEKLKTKNKKSKEKIEDKKTNLEKEHLPNKEMPSKETEKDTKNDEKENKVEVKKKKTEKVKRFEATVNAYDIPISTRHSVEICRFIKGKEINLAIKELELVLKLKKAIPMRGEIPHKGGERMSSGRYPIKSVKNFLVLLRSLLGNSNQNEIDEPIITLAIANSASRPYGKFGRVRKKRTHIFIKAIEKKKIKELNKKPKTH